MISFTPTDEQQMLLDTVRRYSAEVVRPAAHEADERGEFPERVVQTGWELGILPGSIPERLGGFAEEYSAITGALAGEELAYGDVSLALHVMAPALVAVPLLLAGTDEQRSQGMEQFLDETPPPVTTALLEPAISFDPLHPKTTAARDDDGCYRLNGAKAYVPLAEGARSILIYARNEESGQVDGFFVDGGAGGLTVGPREKLMGIRALPMNRLTLENVRVDPAQRLGGEAEIDFSAILAHSRVALGALAVGVMRAALDYAVNYAKEREQFGAPIATKQAIAFMLAECAIEIDAAQLMVWEAAWALDQGADASKAAYLAKEYTSQAALMVTDAAVQTLGGHGYIREHPVERWLRDARGFAAFEGLAMV